MALHSRSPGRARTLLTASSDRRPRTSGPALVGPGGQLLLMWLVLLSADLEHLPLLPLTAAVAVCDVAGSHAQIKWPDDVVIA